MQKFKMYQIYTFPACEKCHKAVELFKERKIPYEEISAASSDGRKKLREFTKTYHKRIRSDEKGWVVLPLISHQNNQDIEIYQGEEGIEKVLRENENLRVSR